MQDIWSILSGMRVADCHKHFYEAEISLPEFLTMDDERLKKIGVEYEFQRKRIEYGLLKFHIHPFSTKSVQVVQKLEFKKLVKNLEIAISILPISD